MAKKFEKKYYNLDFPSSYSGKSAFLSTLIPKDKNAAEKWLEKEHTYLRHRTVPRKFERLPTIAGYQTQVQGDLIDVSHLSRENDKNRYIFTVIDAFSRLGFAEAIPDKRSETVAAAFEKILKKMNYIPIYFFSDQGKEFYGKFRTMLKKNNILFYTSKDKDIKASLAERFNRTIMTKLARYLSKQNSNRYIDVLPFIIDNYNKQYHSSIGTSPSKVTRHNKERVWLRLHHKCARPKKKKKVKTELKISDHVIIPKTKKTFAKGYQKGWSDEIFRINKLKNTVPQTYVLEDLSGEVIEGVFYRQEIQKVDLPKTFEIDSILKVKGTGSKKEFFIKWKNYPSKFNQWVLAKDVHGI